MEYPLPEQWIGIFYTRKAALFCEIGTELLYSQSTGFVKYCFVKLVLNFFMLFCEIGIDFLMLFCEIGTKLLYSQTMVL